MKTKIANPISDTHYQNSFILANYSSITVAIEAMVNNLKNIVNTAPQETISVTEKGVVTICGTPYDFTITTDVKFEQFNQIGNDFNFRMIHIDFSFFYDGYSRSYTINGKRIPNGVISDFQRYGTGNLNQNAASANAELEQYKNDLNENLLEVAPKLLQYQIKPLKNSFPKNANPSFDER